MTNNFHSMRPSTTFFKREVIQDQCSSFLPSQPDLVDGEVAAAERDIPLTFTDYVKWALFQYGGRAFRNPRFLYFLFDRGQRYTAQRANELFWSDFNKKNQSYEEFTKKALDPRQSNQTIARLHRWMQEFKGPARRCSLDSFNQFSQ